MQRERGKVRIYLATAAGVVALFVATLIVGILLGALGKAESAIWLFVFTAIAGAVSAEVTKLVSAPEQRGRAIFLICGLVGLLLVISLVRHWNEVGGVAWGSVLLEGAILLGLFGSWCRWELEGNASGPVA
jgi:hypothetical protein